MPRTYHRFVVRSIGQLAPGPISAVNFEGAHVSSWRILAIDVVRHFQNGQSNLVNVRGKYLLLSNVGLSRKTSSLLVSKAQHLALIHGNRSSIGERAGCADQAHLAQTRHKPLKTHDRTQAHIACFYLALLIGRLFGIFPMTATLPVVD